jgi:hypothetical protein
VNADDPRRPDFDNEWLAELEDRAAEQVDRDWLLGIDRLSEADRADGRREQLEHDRALFAARALRDAELHADRPHRHYWRDDDR